LFLTCNDFENPKFPCWALVAWGLLSYLYHLLDNCDGKQAIKTNNSSALGMILDHGFDSISAMMNFIVIG
jgi:ethanolaminephosphotransferase